MYTEYVIVGFGPSCSQKEKASPVMTPLLDNKCCAVVFDLSSQWPALRAVLRLHTPQKLPASGLTWCESSSYHCPLMFNAGSQGLRMSQLFQWKPCGQRHAASHMR